jgi:predicted AlkP superfamily phosphohydrolase/phosphomutase
LTSTTPPISPVAWASVLTGRGPGKHGVYDFDQRHPGHYASTPVTSRTIRGPKLWDLLNHHGKQVGVIRVPMCYPPEPLDGFMIAGTYFTAHTRTYPPTLQQELRDHVDAYAQESVLVKFGRVDHHSRHDYARALETYVHSVTAETCYTMERFNWDCLLTVFTSTDRVQHDFWSDPTFILQHYQLIDHAIDTINSHLDDETLVIVLSDHGTCAAKQEFNLAHWLITRGYMTVKPQSTSLSREYLSLLLSKLPIALVNRIKRHVSITVLDKLYRRLPSAFAEHIQYDATTAFCTRSLQNCAGIFINLTGRESLGIVTPTDYNLLLTQLMDGLRQVRDPATNTPVIKQIWKRDDLYHGSCVNEFPDLIIAMDTGYRVFPNLYHHQLFSPPIDQGIHDWNGLFLASGPGVKPGLNTVHATLMDLVPTILHVFDLPIPLDLDGHVLDLFSVDSPFTQRPVRYESTPHVTPLRPQQDSDPEVDNDVMARLHQLGYL